VIVTSVIFMRANLLGRRRIKSQSSRGDQAKYAGKRGMMTP
jgi:hypothetical protein